MVLIKDILDRIKEYGGVKKDSDIARLLNVEPQNVFNWKKRGTIPWEELCNFAISKNLSFDWLFTGKKDDSSDPDVHKATTLLKKIYTHPQIKKALQANLEAFNLTYDTLATNQNYVQGREQMEDRIQKILDENKLIIEKLTALEIMHKPVKAKIVAVSKQKKS